MYLCVCLRIPNSAELFPIALIMVCAGAKSRGGKHELLMCLINI